VAGLGFINNFLERLISVSGMSSDLESFNQLLRHFVPGSEWSSTVVLFWISIHHVFNSAETNFSSNSSRFFLEPGRVHALIMEIRQ